MDLPGGVGGACLKSDKTVIPANREPVLKFT